MPPGRRRLFAEGRGGPSQQVGPEVCSLVRLPFEVPDCEQSGFVPAHRVQTDTGRASTLGIDQTSPPLDRL